MMSPRTIPDISRTRKRWQRLALALLVISPLLFIPPAFGSREKREAEKDRIEDALTNYHIKISRLEQRINSQKAQSDEAVSQEKDILHELEEIDILLARQIAKVHELENQVVEQQMLIEVKQKEIGQLQGEKERTQGHLKKRVNAYYRMGKIGFLNVAFSTSSLPELVDFHEAYQKMIAYDKTVLDDYKRKLTDLEQAKKVYLLEQELLKGFITTTLDERQETSRLRQEKRELLASVRTQKQLFDRAVEEMEEASKKLSSDLASLQNRKDELEQEFKLSKGELPPPVEGSVITTFNQEKANRLGITRKSAGISIVAPDRTEVQAVSDGTVIFSGYLRGYGNTVIIHHGYQYFTITSRLGRLLKEKGDRVQAGNVIGQVSDTAMLIDEGLYFEIRHGKTPQDPLLWLDTASLRLPDHSLPEAGA